MPELMSGEISYRKLSGSSISIFKQLPDYISRRIQDISLS